MDGWWCTFVQRSAVSIYFLQCGLVGKWSVVSCRLVFVGSGLAGLADLADLAGLAGYSGLTGRAARLLGYLITWWNFYKRIIPTLHHYEMRKPEGCNWV